MCDWGVGIAFCDGVLFLDDVRAEARNSDVAGGWPKGGCSGSMLINLWSVPEFRVELRGTRPISQPRGKERLTHGNRNETERTGVVYRDG